MVRYLLLGLLFSCANTYRPPESYSSKMGRYKSRGQQAFALKIPVDTKFSMNSRSFASKKIGPYKRYSHRLVYFLTLIEQYDEFRSFADRPFKKIRSCPSLHNTFLEYRTAKSSPSKIELRKDLPPKDKLFAYPEYFLSLSKKGPTPFVYEYLTKNPEISAKQTLQKAINIHVQSLKDELKELCEYGRSDHSYIFENYVTALKKGEALPNDKETLKILVSLRPLSNMLLLNSLKRNQRMPAQWRPTPQDELLSRLKAPWMNGYLRELQNNR